MSRRGIETLYGKARFNEVGLLQVGDREVEAKYYHITTGARPATLGIPGEEYLTTNTDFLERESAPKRIIFVGGGFIAFEFAYISKRAEASEVTLLQRGKHTLVNFDPDLIDMQAERTRELGITVHCEAVVKGITKDGSEFIVEYSTPHGKKTVSCDHVVTLPAVYPILTT